MNELNIKYQSIQSHQKSTYSNKKYENVTVLVIAYIEITEKYMYLAPGVEKIFLFVISLSQ